MSQNNIMVSIASNDGNSSDTPTTMLGRYEVIQYRNDWTN